MKLLRTLLSSDGTKKYVWSTKEGYIFETVFVSLDYRRLRNILCIATQIGCPVGCKFCRSGEKYYRNLRVDEIEKQISNTIDDNKDKLKLRNGKQFEVSFMAMGEPLLNWNNLCEALQFLDQHYENTIDVTVSTVGVVPRIYDLANAEYSFPLDLHVSLHAPTDVLRNKLIPINKVYPLQEVIDSAEYYAKAKKRKVCANYVLLHGLNDHKVLARRLANLVDGGNFYVKLSYLNSDSTLFQPASPRRFRNFEKALVAAGIETKRFRSKGRDIFAGCGQLYPHS